MKHLFRALTLGFFLLAALAGAQTQAPAPPPAPCLDLSARPAAARPAAPRGGFINQAAGIMGIDSGIQAPAGEHICPLSAGQKFRFWARKSYSPVNIVAAAFDAAIWQASQPRSEGGYGQGWDAYGSRFGASLANTESSRWFQTFLFPTLLREDPRYFREAYGTAGHRFKYAITRVLVARTDSGRRRFNFSEVAGAFSAAALTNAYYPDADRTASRTLSSAGLNLAASAGWNVLYEFGPDFLHKLKREHKK